LEAAADELAVTPGAISHQIKALEDCLGVLLFVRETRSVSLTDAGWALLPDITHGFLQIRDAVDMVRPSATPMIQVAGMVIRFWVVPRLHTFSEIAPEVQTQLQSSNSWEELNLAENDVAIRLAAEPPKGVYARKVHQLLPVASSASVDEHGIRSTRDAPWVPLLEEVVVQIFDRKPAWESWFDAAGLGTNAGLCDAV